MYSSVAVLFTWPKAKFLRWYWLWKRSCQETADIGLPPSLLIPSADSCSGSATLLSSNNVTSTLFRFNISSSAEINNKGGITRWPIRTFNTPQAFELLKIDKFKFPPSRGQKGGSIALPFSPQMPLLKENSHLSQSFNIFSCLWTEKCWWFPQNFCFFEASFVWTISSQKENDPFL